MTDPTTPVLPVTPAAIGILGAGRVGGGLARTLAAAGREVTLGHRRPLAEAEPEAEAAQEFGADGAIRLADQRTTAAAADIVVNATPGDSALARMTALRTELAGKILVDVSNATTH